jgi:tetratricopeptide (TPR) repeat protein
MTFQEINNLRKQGKLEEAYRLAREALQNAPDDLWLNRAMGWVLYDLIKRELQTVSDDEEDGIGADSASSNLNFGRIQRYFAEYQRLQLPSDDTWIRSQMLRLAAKAQKAGWQGFLEFVEWWGLEHLTENDWQPYHTDDGRELPSLALSAFYGLGRALKSLDRQDSRVGWIYEWLQEAQRRYPNDQWLVRSSALALAKLGRLDEAREAMRQVLRKNSREWWRWKDMAELLETSNPEQAIMCYYRACALERDKTKLVGVYVRLAQLLAQQSRFAEAAWCAKTARDTRESKGWKIPQELQELVDSDWFAQHKDAPKPRVSTERFAMLFVKGIPEKSVQLKRAVLNHHNTEKGIAYFQWSPREGIAVPYRAFPNVQNAPIGSMAEVEIAPAEGRTVVIACRLVPFEEIPNFARRVRGRLQRRADRNHGFVQTDSGERYFTPPNVVGELPNGATVESICVYKHDPRRDEESWVVLHLEAIS